MVRGGWLNGDSGGRHLGGGGVAAVAGFVRNWWTGSPRPKLDARWTDFDASPHQPPWEGVILELHGRYKDAGLRGVGLRWCKKRRLPWRRTGCARGILMSVANPPATLRADHSVEGHWHLDHIIGDMPAGGHVYAWAHVGRRQSWMRVRSDRWLTRSWRRFWRRRRSRRLQAANRAGASSSGLVR